MTNCLNFALTISEHGFVSHFGRESNSAWLIESMQALTPTSIRLSSSKHWILQTNLSILNFININKVEFHHVVVVIEFQAVSRNICTCNLIRMSYFIPPICDYASLQLFVTWKPIHYLSFALKKICFVSRGIFYDDHQIYTISRAGIHFFKWNYIFYARSILFINKY